jgi:hypothetical protein
MARRLLDLNGRAVTVSPLEPPGAGERHIALMNIAVTDETTGRAPLSPLSAKLAQPLPVVSVRIVGDGLVGVAGKAAQAFSPALATNATVSIDISAPHFTTRHLDVPFACSLRTLMAPAGAALTLDSAAGLIAGSRLLISTPDGLPAEIGTVSVLGPGVNEVTLENVPSAVYPVGSLVQPLPPDAALELHHEPVLIAGRVLKRSGATLAPLANATVRVSKLWRQVPLAGSAAPPEPPMVGLPPPPSPWPAPIAPIFPPLYGDFAAGTLLEVEDRPVDAGMSAKTLLDDNAAGMMELRLSDAVGLAVGDVLAIDADDTGTREILDVAAIALSATAADWARVTFHNPLALAHRAGRIVRRLAPIAPAVTRILNYDGVAGDGALLFDTTAIAGTHQVRVTDAGPPIRHSYHQLAILAAVTDADGFYRLPPLTRAGKIEIAAKDSGSAATGAVELVPDYSVSETQRDVTVS